MIKIIVGGMLIMTGIVLTFTVVGALIGVPMMVVGFGMAMAGYASLAKSTVKGGIAAAKYIKSKSEG